MIRAADYYDVPAVLGMVKDLHASTRVAMTVDDAATAQTLNHLVSSDDGMLLVVDVDGHLSGFIAATVGFAPVSFDLLGMELGWWASPGAKGAGLRLLILYERWAKSKGCTFVRMSTPPHNERAAQILRKRGFFVSELAWAKAI